ncbi:MAG: hypothetical protein QW666_01150 [Candidatus Woesearchaeota archaeon]
MESEATKLVSKKKLFEDGNPYTVFFKGRHPLYALAQEYLKAFSGRDVHPAKMNFDKNLDLKDRFRARMLSCAKSLDPKTVVMLLPLPVIRKLTGDTVEIRMDDGNGSCYDAIENKIEAKGTHDFYHEIGHFYWNKAIIPINEPEQRKAVQNSLSADKTRRIALEDRLIPAVHKKYAQLVGAHSGQFLFPDGTFYARMNDLDEHFARNFDYLVRGQPLEVLDRSKASLKDLLDFYQENGIIDVEFRKFYEASMQEKYGVQDLKRIRPPYDMKDGNPLKLDEIADLLVFKKRLKSFSAYGLSRLPNLPLDLEVSLRLDITPEFAGYCLAKNKDKVIESLQYAGTGSREIIERIRKS